MVTKVVGGQEISPSKGTEWSSQIDSTQNRPSSYQGNTVLKKKYNVRRSVVEALHFDAAPALALASTQVLPFVHYRTIIEQNSFSFVKKMLPQTRIMKKINNYRRKKSSSARTEAN